MSLPFVAQKIMASMPTNNESARGSLVKLERQLRANKAAGEFFRSQAPWYQRMSTWWVVSARKEENKTQAVFRAHRAFAESAHSATACAREEQVTWPQVM